MQPAPPSPTPSTHWLDAVELLSAIGAAGGTIAAIVTQQLAFASVPLTLSVALNLANRKRLIAQLAQNVQTSRIVHTEEIDELTTQLTNGLNQQKSLITTLNQQHEKTVASAKYLRAIANCTQAIDASRADADVYYLRGVSHHQMGDLAEAIEDYTAALELNSKHAKAYFNRGVANGQTDNKRGSVADLRAAARFFFENGDVDNYQKAKNLSRDAHNIAPLDADIELKVQSKASSHDEESPLLLEGFLG